MKVVANAYIIADESGNLIVRGESESREIAFVDEPQTKLPAIFKSKGHAQGCLKRAKSIPFSKTANAYRRTCKGMGDNYKQWLRVIPCTITIDF